MRIFYKTGLALVVGVVAGGAAIEALHAQRKPPVYYVALIDIFDPVGYKEFAPKARAVFKGGGGKYLAGSDNVIALDGQPPKRLVIQQWESVEQLKAARSTKEFNEVHNLAQKYANLHDFAVEGLPE